MTQQKERLVSLDVLRGMTIALMILVNTPGSWSYVYSPLLHATWDGMTLTDVVFPLFLFIMGMSMAFSMKKVHKGKKSIIFKILKRSFILFILGLFLNFIYTFDLATLRIPGVLQRISVVFFVSSILLLYSNRTTLLAITFGILIIYWGLLTFVPYNGHIPVSLTPTDNLAAYIDNLLLKGHLWSVTKTWDPEGILSTLPAVSSTLIGLIFCLWIRDNSFSKSSFYQSILMGTVLIFIGILLHPLFPINKNLWTSTYVLVTSGIGIILFSLLYWWIDKSKYSTQKFSFPFRVFGINSIVAYVLSGLLAVLFYKTEISGKSIQSHLFDALHQLLNNPYLASLIYAILFTTLIYIPILILYKKKIIIKT